MKTFKHPRTEKKLKQQVSELLDEAGAWYFMPVPTGMQKATLDFLGCYKGFFFSVETKSPEGEPTKRQAVAMEAIGEAGGEAFWGDGPHLLDAICGWIAAVDAGNYP